MDKNFDLYFEGQSENAKLIYTTGILWADISARLDKILAKVNLNISKFNILMIIKHIGAKDGIQQNEISKRLLVTASNITKLLDKLENEGMITRNEKKGDKRVKLIKITKNASKLLDNIWTEYNSEIENITKSINKKELKTLETMLFKWLKEIN